MRDETQVGQIGNFKTLWFKPNWQLKPQSSSFTPSMRDEEENYKRKSNMEGKQSKVNNSFIGSYGQGGVQASPQK